MSKKQKIRGEVTTAAGNPQAPQRMGQCFKDQFKTYSKASVPFVWVTTHEEDRAVQEIYAAADSTPEHKVFEWDGILGLRFKDKNGKYSSVTDTSIKDVLEKIKNWPEMMKIFVMKDFHHWIEAPGITRGLRNLMHVLKAKGSTMVFLSPVIKVPQELARDMTMLDFEFPSEAEINETITFVKNSIKVQQNKDLDLTDDIRRDLIVAAKGLTKNELETAIVVAVVKHQGFSPAIVDEVFQEKVRQLRHSSNITHVNADIDFDQIGGMVGLKDWISIRAKAFSEEARTYGLPTPRGILLCGVPGCGKSLFAKAVAKMLGVPMFQADIGALFGKYVGETEERFRQMINTVDSVGRCVLFIDEIEKGLSKQAVSGQGDTGTSSRSFGTLLTWLSDRTSQVFIVGTSNDFTILPPALVRKGRFDEVFWLDLPDLAEREEVLKVQLIKYKRDPSKFDLKKVSENIKDFAGSEIEQLVVAAMFKSFNEGKDIDTQSLIDEAKHIIPHAITNAEQLSDMRDQAKDKLRSVKHMGYAKK